MVDLQTVVHFNSTAMDPDELALSVKNLVEQGYTYAFSMRGWQYFVLYPNGRV